MAAKLPTTDRPGATHPGAGAPHPPPHDAHAKPGTDRQGDRVPGPGAPKLPRPARPVSQDTRQTRPGWEPPAGSARHAWGLQMLLRTPPFHMKRERKLKNTNAQQEDQKTRAAARTHCRFPTTRRQSSHAPVAAATGGPGRVPRVPGEVVLRPVQRGQLEGQGCRRGRLLERQKAG